MRDALISLVVLFVALGAASVEGQASGAQMAEAVRKLPVNRWVKLAARPEPGYTFSQPIYVPTREQVLHWGAVGSPGASSCNDVRVFDVTRANWVSDCSPVAKLPPLLSIHNRGAGRGVSYTGTGEMLDCGTPAPSLIVNGVCYDSKRDQVIYTMKGLMAAYYPHKNTWQDMEAKTIIDGKEYPGGPPIYGVGTCYDPVNDEIVLFPHWGGKNTDMRQVTGQTSAHYGTFIYSFKDNTWRRVPHTFGSQQTRKARKEVIELMDKLSKLLDEAWALRRHPDADRAAEVSKGLAALAHKAEVVSLPASTKKYFAKVISPLKASASNAGAGRMPGAIHSGSEALRCLQVALDKPLRVEPPSRCGTPLLYDPKHKVIVMFGGHNGLVRTDLGPAGHLGGGPGALNDTWLYDVRTKQWQKVPCKRRPPETLWPRMVYEPASGLVLLVVLEGGSKDGKVTLWAFDAAKGEWTKRQEQDWPGPVARRGWYGWSHPIYEVALDQKQGLLLLMQNLRQDKVRYVQETHAMRLDLSRMRTSTAPVWVPPPAIKPIEIPPDDLEWVAKLKSLPANKWIHARPPRETPDRAWGIAACDPVRGWVVYFGGGHATYQVNDVAIYAVGANRWVHAAGDHNDWVPPVGWGGITMGMRGGAHAHHQRNTYVAIDGRMYVSAGAESRRWGAESAKRPGPRYAWFYDIDRGGVWRQQRIGKVGKGPRVPGLYGMPHLVHLAGQVLGFGGALEPYDGRFFAGEVYFANYDIYQNKLSLRTIPPPFPGIVYECRPFCTLPDSNQIFFYECVTDKEGNIKRQGTWVYDIKENRFTNLKPRRMPEFKPKPGSQAPATVEYLEGQDAVIAVLREGWGGPWQQWVYSFKHNTWAPLPRDSDSEIGFTSPYGQMVYVAKYGVLVNMGSASKGTAVMRPDVSQVKWE